MKHAWLPMWVGVVCLGLVALFLAAPSPPPNGLAAAVIIETENSAGHGSGIFISTTQILTAKHVADNPDLRVRGPEGDLYRIVAVSDGPADISIITVDRPLRGGKPLGVSCERVKRGDHFHYYGSPGSLEFVGPIDIMAMGGRMVGEQAQEDPSFVNGIIMTDGESEPGVSGSGVLDSSGRVVGVYTIAWPGTIFGGFVSLSFPDVCEFVEKELCLDETH